MNGNGKTKTGADFHKSVKQCKTLRCLEAQQFPHDLGEGARRILLRRTFGLSVSDLPPENLFGAFSQLPRELFYIPTPSAFTLFIPDILLWEVKFP